MHKRDGNYNSTAKQIGFPFTNKLDRLYIFNLGQRLLQEFVIKETRSSSKKKKELGKITSLCLAFQTLERLESGQQGIEGFFQQNKGSKELNKLEMKEGSRIEIKDGFEVQDELKEDSLKPQTSSSTQKIQSEGVLTDFFNSPNSIKVSKSRLLEYKCDRCEKMIRLDIREGWKESKESESERFERLKVEHSDEHFAKDLWNEDRMVVPVVKEEEPAKKKIKVEKREEDESKRKPIQKKAKGGGIDSFFKPVSESTSSKKP